MDCNPQSPKFAQLGMTKTLTRSIGLGFKIRYNWVPICKVSSLKQFLAIL